VRRIGLILVIAALAATCGEAPTVEQQIIGEIRAMEAEIEAGERLNFMRHVSVDFRGRGGAMSREELRAYVVLQFNRYKNLQARLFPITVSEVSEREATADFKALVSGGPNWIPEDGQLYDMKTHWRLEDDQWLLVAAYWEPVPLGDLID